MRFAISLLAFLAIAKSQTCPLPINPSEDFVDNFYRNPGAAACYASHLPIANGVAATGDPNALYSQGFYTVAPGYELVVLGTFPNSRFFSATLYDSHVTTIPTNYVFDYQLPPLFGNMTNPFTPNTPFTPGQMYGFTVAFGGTAGPVAPGCKTGSTFGQTVFNATQIHTGYSWNDAVYPPPPAPFPVHLAGANSGGILQLREYDDYTFQKTGKTPPSAVVIVRELSDGCAITAGQATTTNNPTGHPIISVNGSVTVPNAGLPWLDQAQIAAHREYYGTSAITPTLTYPLDSFAGQQAQWVRSSDWVSRNNTAAAYLSALLPEADLTAFLNGTSVMRIRFELPTNMPSIPCNPTGDTCSLTGNEALRYFSMEFTSATLSTYIPPNAPYIGEAATLWALDDSAFVKSATGHVTLIVGISSTVPAGVTPMNGYTYFNLGPYLTGVEPGFNSILIRNLLANSSFSCSTFNVPSYTMEYNNAGGFMGAYVPTVDFPAATTSFGRAHAPGRGNTCLAIPAAPSINFDFPRTPV